MREAASLRRRPETKTAKYYITASGGRVTNIPGDDYLHDCYESMRSSVDKRTVNVKFIAGFHRRTSLKGKDEQCGVVEEVGVIGRSDSSGPLSLLIKCLRQVAVQICKWMKATQKKKNSKREGKKKRSSTKVQSEQTQIRTTWTPPVLLRFEIFSFACFCTYASSRLCDEWARRCFAPS